MVLYKMLFYHQIMEIHYILLLMVQLMRVIVIQFMGQQIFQEVFS